MFDIEPVSLGVSILLMLGFIAPIYIYKIKQAKKALFQKTIFKQSEREFGLECDLKDFWRDYYAIGLDSEKRILVYIKFDAEPEIQVTDLKDCVLVSQHQQKEEIQNGNRCWEFINYLGLKLNVQKNHQQEIHLEFYNGDLFSDHQGEGPLVLKWKELIAQQLKKTS